MTISFPITLPNSGAALSEILAVTFRQRTVVGQSRSPFSGGLQTYRHPGQWWEADVRLPLMSRIDGEPWVAALASLNGREGSLLMGDPLGTSPRGAISGSPLLVGSHAARSATLTIDALPASATVLKAGDWLQVGSSSTSRLYKVLADAWSTGSGVATVDIWPRTRTAYEDNAPIVYTNTKGVWKLADNEQPWEISPPNNYSIAFTLVEDL